MKNIRLFAMIAIASLVSISFNSCDDDDDNDINKYDVFDSCTWDELSKEAKFLSTFPELEGTFYDGSVLLDQSYEEDKQADMVAFSYDIPSDKLDSYIQELEKNKFCIQRLGSYFLANKVENGYEYTIQCSEELFTILAIKYLNNDDYEYELEKYQERLENATPSNATWTDVANENEWLKELPAPTFRFSQYKVVSDDEIAITGKFSLVSLETYAQQLEAADFVEMPNTSRSTFKKEVETGGYYIVTMNEVMIDYRNFTDK